MKKVLLLDSVHPLIPEMLSAAGFECTQAETWTRDQISGNLSDISGIIVRSRILLDQSLLEHGPALEFIARVGSGMENIDLPYCRSRSIPCFNSPEGNRDAVGEHCLGMLLSLMNHLNRADRQVRSGKWIREGNRGTEIKGKTVGIVGYGNMGSAFAQRLKGFEVKILAYDKFKAGYSDGHAEESTLRSLFEKADIVSMHVPYDASNHYLVNDEYLASFHKPVILINTSRGKVVDTAALVRAMKAGIVLAAALDVLEYEDVSFERLVPGSHPDLDFLRTAENVILTPHIAGWTEESAVKLASVLAEKIITSIPTR